MPRGVGSPDPERPGRLAIDSLPSERNECARCPGLVLAVVASGLMTRRSKQLGDAMAVEAANVPALGG